MKLSEKAIKELRSFIVDSNLETSLLVQLNDKTTSSELKK